MRELAADAIEDLATGAAILGTGGGGDPHIGKLMAQSAIAEHGPVELLDPTEVPADALVIPTAGMGAPTVLIEKPPAGTEPIAALRRVAAEFEQEVFATMPIECGGINSTIPFAVAAREGLPVVDADGMGRAFPELHHETFNVYGVSGSPACVADEHGNTTLIEATDNRSLEDLARAITIEMGGQAYVSDYPMTGEQVRDTAIANTVDLGIRIGAAVRDPPADATPIEAIKRVTADSSYGRAIELFHGKIVDVERRTEAGFAVGTVMIEGFDADAGDRLTIDFQNENLIARRNGTVVATVPDLITVLEQETGEAITTEGLRYGYRVRVLGIPSPAIMRSEGALSIWGPRSFEYDVAFTPLERQFPAYYREHGVPETKTQLLE
ncbi:MAG: DUF917 domain-containing protein [Halobacteriales archaeon]|nr:DUF917 domain-containing protein [Halobacteriales archaeon]